MRFRQNNALTTAADDAALLPGAQEPAHRVQRGAGHLRDILARYGEVDFYAGVDAPAGLVHQPQQGARDAPLDAFGHELAVAALQIVQSAGDELHGVEGYSGLGLQHLSRRAGCPHEGDRRLDRFRANRIREISERARAAEGVAGTNDAQDYLVSLRRQLCQLHTAAREDEERFSLVSLVEEELTGADRFRVRLTSDARQHVDGQALKQRNVAELSGECRSVVGTGHWNLCSADAEVRSYRSD